MARKQRRLQGSRQTLQGAQQAASDLCGGSGEVLGLEAHPPIFYAFNIYRGDG